MVGIIYKVLYEFLRDTGDEEVIGRVSARAGIDLAQVRIIDSLPDRQFSQLLQLVLEETGMQRPAVVEAFSDAFLDYAEKLFPEFFEMSDSSRAFLIRQPKIHSTLGAGLSSDHEKTNLRQKFRVTDCDDGALEVSYESAAGLCDLYQSLAHKVAARYGDRLSISVKHCGGGSGCTLRLLFNGAESDAPVTACNWTAVQ